MKILDSTLREGEQTPGVAFPPHVKVRIASLLDQIGVDFIEVGHPVVSANIRMAIERIARSGLNAKAAAHSRSLLPDVEAALECGADFLGIFYCVSNDRLTEVFRETIGDACRRIQESISYAKEHKPDLIVRYTPEDTVRSRYTNVIEAARAAVEAGADIISVADTTGYMIPHQRSMYDFIARLKEDLASFGHEPMLAVHCHNDCGFALANAIDGVRAGAEIVDTTVMGLGERAGIVDLAQLLAAFEQFELQGARPNENRYRLDLLPQLYEVVSEFTRIPVPPNAPIVGENAFTHCAGVHTHAAAKNPAHYESLSPEKFGRTRRFALDHMSGMSSIRASFDLLGLEFEPEIGKEVLSRVKEIGQSGRIVTMKEFEMIVRWFLDQDKNAPCQEQEERKERYGNLS